MRETPLTDIISSPEQSVFFASPENIVMVQMEGGESIAHIFNLAYIRSVENSQYNIPLLWRNNKITYITLQTHQTLHNILWDLWKFKSDTVKFSHFIPVEELKLSFSPKEWNTHTINDILDERENDLQVQEMGYTLENTSNQEQSNLSIILSEYLVKIFYPTKENEYSDELFSLFQTYVEEKVLPLYSRQEVVTLLYIIENLEEFEKTLLIAKDEQNLINMLQSKIILADYPSGVLDKFVHQLPFKNQLQTYFKDERNIKHFSYTDKLFSKAFYDIILNEEHLSLLSIPQEILMKIRRTLQKVRRHNW